METVEAVQASGARYHEDDDDSDDNDEEEQEEDEYRDDVPLSSSGLEELARAPLEGKPSSSSSRRVSAAVKRRGKKPKERADDMRRRSKRAGREAGGGGGGVSGFQALVKRVVELTTELSSQVRCHMCIYVHTYTYI